LTGRFEDLDHEPKDDSKQRGDVKLNRVLIHTGFTPKAVSIPSEIPMPRKAIKTTRGTNPAGGGPLFLSVAAQTAKRSIAVPRNSEKKQAATVR